MTETLTRRIARLARLELTDSEVTLFTQQLGDILRYVETLREVEALAEIDAIGSLDGNPMEPLIQPLGVTGTSMRDDLIRHSPTNSQGKPKVLDSAPDVDQGGYKVPPIL